MAAHFRAGHTQQHASRDLSAAGCGDIVRSVDPDDGIEEDGPFFPWLPPDDRLWRHPSEMANNPPVARSRLDTASRETDRRLWAVALLAGVVGALLASGTGVLAGSFDRSTTVVRPFERIVDPSTPYLTVAASPKMVDVVKIAEELRPTIVELLVNGNGSSGSGSGVIFRSDGYVLTNDHVVEGAQSVMAVLSDGHRVNARVVGMDPATDIAVVKLIEDTDRAVAILGSSAALKVGQLAVAIGSPLGLSGGPSVTSGIISAVGRQVDSGNGTSLLGMIQTDASIAPGSSGGALVDSAGMVIGITTSVVVGDQGPQGMGFATPIEVARSVATQLLATGKATHVWLGVQGADIDAATADSLGVSGGAVVQNVDADSPAAKAGIVASDVITEVAGQPVGTMGALDIAVEGRKPGERIAIVVMRDGRPKSVTAALVERTGITSSP